MTVVRRVRETIARYGMLRPGERAVVAVSGGPDSVALLFGLHELRGELDVELIVAHFDHRMRPDSHEDAAFVGRLAGTLKLPFELGQAQAPLKSEDEARRARYRFLREAARRHGAQAVALGHTLNDRVETFFINLLRGAGLEGLAGLPPVRPDPECDLRYVRPLVECPRDEILSFLRARGLPYREDPTNRDLKPLRNRVRWELLPLLQKLNPSALEAVVRASEIARRAHEALVEELDARWPTLLAGDRPEPEGERALALRRGELLRLPPILQEYAVRRALRAVGGGGEALAAEHVERVLAEARKRRSGQRVTLPQGLLVTVERDRLRFAFAPAARVRYNLPHEPGKEARVTWRS